MLLTPTMFLIQGRFFNLIELLYGTETINLNIDNDFDVLAISDSEKRISETIFKENLLSFFNKTEYDFTEITIIVSDKTRKCDYDVYLPVLVNTLESLGAVHDCITFYIAYGTHPPQSETESLVSYGEIFKSYKFVHHDCRNKEIFSFFGESRRGTEIAYRKDFLNSSFKISFGSLSHHYFAGYGGGRKLVFPGLGYQYSIYNNHSLFLVKENQRLCPDCQAGILKNNPLADDLKEVTDSIKIDLSIHGILDSHAEVTDLILGKDYSDFEAACEIHAETTEFETDRLYDTVVASCGGYPKDINFIQVHKSIHYASDFVKDGGELYLFAECRDGIGSETFIPWFEEESFKDAFEKLSDNYSGNGGTALSLMTKEKRISINLLTDLDDELCKKIGINKLNEVDLNEINLLDKSILVIPNASMAVKKPSSKLSPPHRCGDRRSTS